MEQIASILAPAATTIAAFIVAANFGARTTGYGFIIFTIGSVAWALLGFATGQPNLLWQNILLTALNLFGMWRWLGRQARLEEGADSAAERSREAKGDNLFPVSLLTKAGLRSGDGEAAGDCVDAMAGCSSGRLSYLVLSEGGLGGVGETLRRVPWDRCRVEGDAVHCDLSQSDVSNLEKIDPDHWPAR
jgi:hypothetical protein